MYRTAQAKAVPITTVYYFEFQSHSRGNTADTAVIPQMPLLCYALVEKSVTTALEEGCSLCE